MTEKEAQKTAGKAAPQLTWDDPDYHGPILEWSCHPMRRRPWVTILVTFFITLVGLAVYYGTDSRWFAVFGVLIIFGSLAKFYFPTSYRLTDRGFLIKTTTQTLGKFWGNFRSYYPDRNGVLLSPFSAPSRLENFRGVYIMFNNNREEVLSFIKSRLSVASSGSSSESPENRNSTEGEAS